MFLRYFGPLDHPYPFGFATDQSSDETIIERIGPHVYCPNHADKFLSNSGGDETNLQVTCLSFCTEDPPLVNGLSHNFQPGDSKETGTIVTYTCDHDPSIKRYSVCLFADIWSPVLCSCETSPENFPYATLLSIESNNIGDVAVFACNEDADITFNVTCEVTTFGETAWSASINVCPQPQCHDDPTPVPFSVLGPIASRNVGALAIHYCTEIEGALISICGESDVT